MIVYKSNQDFKGFRKDPEEYIVLFWKKYDYVSLIKLYSGLPITGSILKDIKEDYDPLDLDGYNWTYLNETNNLWYWYHKFKINPNNPAGFNTGAYGQIEYINQKAIVYIGENVDLNEVKSMASLHNFTHLANYNKSAIEFVRKIELNTRKG